LDAEWDHLATSTTAAETVARWRRHTPQLAGFTTFETIRQAVHDRAHPQHADQILAALAQLGAVTGHGDQMAAWLILQLLKPGAVRLAHHLTPLAGDLDTSQALVFGELMLGIREYPWQRRPRQIAANLLLDCRQRITRARQRHHAEVPCGLSIDSNHRQADHDLLDNRLAVRHLLWTARQRGMLSAFDVRLLSGVYLDDTPVDQLAASLGRSRSTLYALRSGAEQRLRDAFAADQPPTYVRLA
jgi:hypothetical protein